MEKVGPLLESLTRRLAETPADFLDEPRIGSTGLVAVPALVNDLLLMHGARAGREQLARFEADAAARNHLALVMIAVWVLADPWWLDQHLPQDALLRLLAESLAELAAGTPAHKFAADPERREELTRVILARLGYRPEGETQIQATDRLASVSGAERRRVLAESRAAERRAREIRAALAKKAAEESADKWSRD
jgi:hypothetical protein